MVSLIKRKNKNGLWVVYAKYPRGLRFIEVSKNKPTKRLKDYQRLGMI